MPASVALPTFQRAKKSIVEQRERERELSTATSRERERNCEVEEQRYAEYGYFWFSSTIPIHCLVDVWVILNSLGFYCWCCCVLVVTGYAVKASFHSGDWETVFLRSRSGIGSPGKAFVIWGCPSMLRNHVPLFTNNDERLQTSRWFSYY